MDKELLVPGFYRGKLEALLGDEGDIICNKVEQQMLYKQRTEWDGQGIPPVYKVRAMYELLNKQLLHELEHKYEVRPVSKKTV